VRSAIRSSSPGLLGVDEDLTARLTPIDWVGTPSQGAVQSLLGPCAALLPPGCGAGPSGTRRVLGPTINKVRQRRFLWPAKGRGRLVYMNHLREEKF
jgi:hypothetical protein